MKSEFHEYRSHYQPGLPQILREKRLKAKTSETGVKDSIKALFPNLLKSAPQAVLFEPDTSAEGAPKAPLRIGVVLSGGQAAGGHNVIVGVYDYIKSRNAEAKLFGFLGGPAGIIKGKYAEITEDKINFYKNRGGFDMICSGRDKIEKEEEFQASKKNCDELKLDGLVVIGGDDSNTNACLLAEYFSKENCHTKIIGCPKTIDGDLKNEFVEVSFGFDTACRVYSEMIGNLALDALSTKKAYHFVRLMGRSASHITLECALHTRPNVALIGEEIQQKKQQLGDIVSQLVQLIVSRAKAGKNYGVILVPEGTIEFVHEVSILIGEINTIMGKKMTEDDKKKTIEEIFKIVESQLTPDCAKLLNFLPRAIAEQLLLDRDPHGNVQVSKIETEKLLIQMAEKELAVLKAKGEFNGDFRPVPHFFGYEGRCAFPTNFDSDYCYSLGTNAAGLIDMGYTGLMSVVRNLHLNPSQWTPGGFPLVTMMDVETRKGKGVPVIKKALVELDGPLFKVYEQERKAWAEGDFYVSPGPIQFEICKEAAKGDKYPQQVPFLVQAPTKETLYKNGKEVQGDAFAKINPNNHSCLGLSRQEHAPVLPELLHGEYQVMTAGGKCKEGGCGGCPITASCKNLMTSCVKNRRHVVLTCTKCTPKAHQQVLEQHTNQKIGVVFAGPAAPGAQNTVHGLLQYCDKTKSELVGFLGGVDGLINNKTIKLTHGNAGPYLNQGGVHLLGQGKTCFHGAETLQKVTETLAALQLDGLVVVGGDKTLTSALHLSEKLLETKGRTRVVAVPAHIDGNVCHPSLEAMVGFDSATKVYAQLIGNILADAASAIKYWYLIRLAGRDPSHVVLEAALQTHPTIAIIAEEVARKRQSLTDVIRDIADVVAARADKGKNFGTILIPEGLLNFIPQTRELIKELNVVFCKIKDAKEREELGRKLVNDAETQKKHLSGWNAAFFASLPEFARIQLATQLDDNHRVCLTAFETERFLAHFVGEDLKQRKKDNRYKGSFATVLHYFGFQGLCSFPSLFDANLGATYGYTAGALLGAGVTGHCVTARGLKHASKHWQVGGIPLVSMACQKTCSVSGAHSIAISNHEIGEHCPSFRAFASQREVWKTEDHNFNPGPIQFTGPQAGRHTSVLNHQQHNYTETLKQVTNELQRLQELALFGVDEHTLATIHSQLHPITTFLNHHHGCGKQ